VVAENKFLGKLHCAAFHFPIYGDNVMKRILLFLFLFFCFLGSIVLGAELDKPPKIVVAPLINFNQLFVKLLDILELLFFQYMELFMGLFVVLLVIAYIQGILEDKVMRAERDQLARRAFEKARANNIQRQVDKQKLREREFIQKYVRDRESVERVQHDMEGDNWKDAVHLYKNDDLRLAPLDDDPDVYPNDMSKYAGKTESEEYYDTKMYEDVASHDTGGRWQTYWRSDGTEEGSEKESKDEDDLFEDTVTIGGNSTVIMREKRRDRFHRGMDDDDEGGGY
jgi:hypothetical protein